jgi:Tol biopolymer transport system component
VGFDGGPNLSVDGRELFFISDRPGGQGGGDIWVANRASPGQPFDKPKDLGPHVNSSGDEGAPSISSDGLTLYFECFEPGPDAHCSKPDFGDPDIWISRRSGPNRSFGRPENLGRGINGPFADSFPDISADGLTLYFSSTRPGGSGDSDLWRATRQSTSEPFGSVENLGPVVNGPTYDGDPAVSSDGLMLFFASDRGGVGGSDLWVTIRRSVNDPFGSPMSLGPGVNSGVFEGRPALSADGSTLYFMSDRPGGYGGVDIWEASITPRGA